MSAGVAGAVSGVSVLVLAILGASAALVGGLALSALGVVALASGIAIGRRRLDEADRYRSVLDHLPLVTVVTHTAADDKAWSGRLHTSDRGRVLDSWQSWLRGPRSEPFRAAYRLAGDRVEDVTIAVAENGEPAFRRHLLDVTRQRALEERLQQAQRLESLGLLAAGVAHDFNNVLAVIAGYGERLDSPPSREIAAAAERGASLARRLVEFSRPQPGDRRLVDLNALLRDFAPILGRVIGEDVALDLRLDRASLPVEVEPVQIDQVLMNVAANARDAMPHGGRLTITTATVELDGELRERLGVGRAARVTVADTGCGMDAATQARIFEPFFSTKGPAKGSGLGLSTVSEIVEQAGGAITVSSRLGTGTTFSVYLPLAASDLRTVVAELEPVRPRCGGAETVLVVEDDPSLRELERLMLEDAGYEVLTAADAAEALALAAERPVDLLVVDVVLPGLSGPRLVEELATRGHDVPAVFVSGYDLEEISSRRFSVPTAVIGKPFQVEALLRIVREVLDGGSPELVRCLACDSLYRPEGHGLLLREGCPRCGYAGWAAAD